jgi:hypothetical protein
MNDQSAVPKWFYVIGAVSLIWNLLGVSAYIMDVTRSDAALAAMPEAERLLYETVPAWATGAFALAVFGGALGCVALLLRQRWAVWAFAVSLIGVCVQMFHAFFMTNSFEVFGPGGAIMPVMVLVIAIALLLAARKWAQRGWLR